MGWKRIWGEPGRRVEVVGPGVPGSPELDCRELKGQADVEEKEFLRSTFCWMVD